MQWETDAKAVARFELDEQGQPKFEEADGRRHYAIELEIVNAAPETYAATFNLDPSYYDPVRTAHRDAQNRLWTEITSYGDYHVKVALLAKTGEAVFSGRLSKALLRGHSTDMSPMIEEAIAYIKNH